MNIKTVAVVTLLLGMLAGVTGCASSLRTNLEYLPAGDNPSRVGVHLKGVVVPAADVRLNAGVYPKQIILQESYTGDKTYDINDKAVDVVFDGALATELARLGVPATIASGIGPLDKTTKEAVRKRLMESYPDVNVAFGLKIKEFFADTKRGLVSTDVKVKSSMEFYALDVETGELFWSEYATDWDDTVVSADRDYLIGQLDDVLSNLMSKAVKDNLTLRDALVRIGSRK